MNDSRVNKTAFVNDTRLCLLIIIIIIYISLKSHTLKSHTCYKFYSLNAITMQYADILAPLIKIIA